MMLFSLKWSLRDDSNEWSHNRVWLRNKIDSILKTINFRPYLMPCVPCGNLQDHDKCVLLLVAAIVLCLATYYLNKNTETSLSYCITYTNIK